MTNLDRLQILRDRIDQISIDAVKLVLSDYKKNRSFSYKEVENLLVNCNIVYKEKLAGLLRKVSLESKEDERKSNGSKEKVST